MKRIGNFICKNKYIILIISLILLIPACIGMIKTDINYNILVYLPDDIETVQGQNVLADDFNMGAFSVAIIDKEMPSKDILKLENKLSKVNGVNKVVSLYDVIGTKIPVEALPNEITSKVKKGDSNLLLITFKDSTSAETTINAVEDIKEITKDSVKISGMSAMVLDTMNLSEKEITIYIVIAVVLCIFVLMMSLDSYLVPFILLCNIGIAILFNMGSNIFLGNISYITKALVAVLQLGVTTDFSIFLYHSYENKKYKYKTKEDAMSEAICETFSSVLGSSLTTIAGFLVLCTMTLTLGKDLGIVMSKGVLLGVICVLTIFPSLLLVFDKLIEKTKHKIILPKFNKINDFTLKHYKGIFVVFLILLVPFYLAYSKVDVYYKIDTSLPRNLDSIVANNELSKKFNIVSPEIILLDKNVKTDKVSSMIEKIKKVDGIDLVLSFSSLKELGINDNLLDKDTISIFESGKYQMILVNSTYDIATDELNNQIGVVNKIVKSYDKKAILAGEGPLMKDLVTTSDRDFSNVNYSSIICILIIMFFVFRKLSLPVLLISAIEFAIFLNMGMSYFGGVTLPFVAPIVLGTIQLGATIDYAILLTNTYIKNRKTKDKFNAMKISLNNCTSSIFVSGMCFFAATFGVGIYSKLEMVGSLCTLISRGALISMLVVIMVLPSILLIFDKLFIKKEKKNMKNIKKSLNKIVSILLVLTLSLMSTPVFALTKNETVYANLKSNGDVSKTVVTDELINDSNLEKLEDVSDLKDILNLNGDETFNKNNESIVWNSNNNVTYQGTSNKNLPVDVKITYYLNNKEMPVDKILGKKGKITIKVSYINKSSKIVNISGENELLYTPFVVTLGTIISGDNNSNIEVINGKVVNNGNSNVVVGIAAPGLYENLKLTELKNMNTITIKYDTTDFKLNTMYNVITPKILDKSDLKIFDKLNDLYDKSNLLQGSIDKIEEGSKTLSLGTNELTTGSKTLTSKLNELLAGIKKIQTGSDKLELGSKQILDKLNESINSFDYDESKKQLNDLLTLKSTNESVISDMTQSLSIAKTSLNNVKEQLDSNNIEYIYNTYNLENTSIDSITDNSLKTVKTQYETYLTNLKTYESNAKILELIKSNNKVVITMLNTLSTTKKTLIELRDAITQIYGGTTTLNSGLNDLYNGTSKITFGSETISNNMEKINNGTKDLNNGINEFNNSGIKTITSLIDSKVKPVTARIKALTVLSDEYNTFTKMNANTKGNVKFVLIVSSEEKKVKELNKVVKKEKTTFLTRIVNLFKW